MHRLITKMNNTLNGKQQYVTRGNKQTTKADEMFFERNENQFRVGRWMAVGTYCKHSLCWTLVSHLRQFGSLVSVIIGSGRIPFIHQFSGNLRLC